MMFAAMAANALNMLLHDAHAQFKPGCTAEMLSGYNKNVRSWVTPVIYKDFVTYQFTVEETSASLTKIYAFECCLHAIKGAIEVIVWGLWGTVDDLIAGYRGVYNHMTETAEAMAKVRTTREAFPFFERAVLLHVLRRQLGLIRYQLNFVSLSQELIDTKIEQFKKKQRLYSLMGLRGVLPADMCNKIAGELRQPTWMDGLQYIWNAIKMSENKDIHSNIRLYLAYQSELQRQIYTMRMGGDGGEIYMSEEFAGFDGCHLGFRISVPLFRFVAPVQEMALDDVAQFPGLA